MVEVELSSQPLKAIACKARFQTTSIEVFNRTQLFAICSEVKLITILSMSWDWFIKSRHALWEILWMELRSFPIWRLKEQLSPFLTFFQLLNLLTVNAFCPSCPVGLWKRKHGRQNAAFFLGEYSSHDLKRSSSYQEPWKLRPFSDFLNFFKWG